MVCHISRVLTHTTTFILANNIKAISLSDKYSIEKTRGNYPFPP
jgi:hypothetical protein